MARTVGLLRRPSTGKPVSPEWETQLRQAMQKHVVVKVRADEARSRKAAVKIRSMVIW